MIGLTNDHIAVDVNIFIHLNNGEKNTNNHIGQLLACGMADSIRLLVDSENVILSEYRAAMAYEGEGELKFVETIAAEFLGYWLLEEDNRVRVPLDKNSPEWQTLQSVMGHGKFAKDRVYVYVALASDRVLLTNDHGIIRKQSAITQQISGRIPPGFDVLTSQQAYARMQQSETAPQPEQEANDVPAQD